MRALHIARAVKTVTDASKMYRPKMWKLAGLRVHMRARMI